MRIFRIFYKFIALLLLAIMGVLLMMVFSSSKNNEGLTAKEKSIRQWWLQKITQIIGVRLEVKGELPREGKPSLWVANHISWMDIPVIGSAGSGFLSKSEVRQWPIIGWLGEKGGTVFIKRGGKNASQIASSEIAKKIHAGDNILVFPEGTTGNGEDVMRFHARIFAPAIDHQLSVQPIAIRYVDAKGEHLQSSAWVNESFISHLMRVLGESSIHVIITFLPILESAQFEQRRELATLAETQIRAVVTAS